MSNSKWIETKQEGEIDENGNFIIKKVTKELEKKKYLGGLERKDVIDISLRLVSMLAIFIPVLLFIEQQKAEKDKQRSLYQLEVFSDATTALHSLLNKKLDSKNEEFEQTKSEILYEVYPKFILLNDKTIIDTFNVIRDILTFSSLASKVEANKELLVYISGHPQSYSATAAQQTFGFVANGAKSSSHDLANFKSESKASQVFIKKYYSKIDFEIKGLLENSNFDSIYKFNIPENENDWYSEFQDDYKNYLSLYTSKIDSMLTAVLYNQ